MKLGLVVFRVLILEKQFASILLFLLLYSKRSGGALDLLLEPFMHVPWQFVKVYAIFPWLILFKSLCTKIVVHGFVDQRMMAWFLCLVVSSCHQVFCITERIVSFWRIIHELLSSSRSFTLLSVICSRVVNSSYVPNNGAIII
jgi:hypothetical protein